MSQEFSKKLEEAIKNTGPYCVGIDPHFGLLPNNLPKEEPAYKILNWSMGVLDVIEGKVSIIKIQSAFFEMWGKMGIWALNHLIGYAKRNQKFIVILDCKRGDIGSTAMAYVKATLDPPGYLKNVPDAVTLSPYLGRESLEPWKDFIKTNPRKGAFVLTRTSNFGASDWQSDSAPKIADWIESSHPSIGAVVGGTIPASEIKSLRARMPESWFLMPGYGNQGAKAKDFKPAFRKDGLGCIISASRSITLTTKEDSWEDAVDESVSKFIEEINASLN